MRWLLLTCWLSLPVHAAALRLIGTNVVDFTAVYQATKNPSAVPAWCAKYLAQGTVTSIREGVAQLRYERTQYVYNPAYASRFGNSSDLLSMMAARQRGPITAGHYFSLGQPLRMAYEPQVVEVLTTVEHCPAQMVDGRAIVPGSIVFMPAWPLGAGRFEYGQPATNTAGCTVLTVTDEGIRAQRMASAGEKADVEQRVMARQHAQAEAGDGSAQYELGRRYLRGLGVETNRALAVEWLSRARTNGYEAAANRALQELAPEK